MAREESAVKALAEIRRSLLGAAAGLATILACASPQTPPSAPTQPPSQTEQSQQQPATSSGQGQASSDATERAQQASEAASASVSGAEAGESAQSESAASDAAEPASSESTASDAAEPASSESAEASGSDRRSGEAAVRENTAADAGQTGSGDTEQGPVGGKQAGGSGEPGETESASADTRGASGSRATQDPSAGERNPPGESGEVGGAGREGAPGDPSETAGGAGGGIPIDEVPPELLEAFGRGGSGTATETLSGEALQRALERLAEHQGQVDGMIQHEQSAAAASSGDIGTDSQGIGAAAPPLQGGQGGRRAEITGGENTSSVSTANSDATTDAGTGYRPPADVGSGNDDDTLAAQLRELAMKETDPVLRERYWQEYRKHKGIQ